MPRAALELRRGLSIIERLQGPKVTAKDAVIENSILTPYRWAETASLYVIRAKPGRSDAVLLAAQRKLLQVDRFRVLLRAQTFAQIRATAYKRYRSMALILGFVSVLLVTITALGVIGLTSLWVAQRHRQIGIRRALGARRGAILRHFHLENLLVVGGGAVLGLPLAMVANVFVVREFETTRMPALFALAGTALMLGLGRLSVLWPALRAAAVPPASVARAL